LRRGVQADVVIMNREGLSELAAEGRFIPGTIVDIARVPMGLAIRPGAPKPNIDTLENFNKTLRGAKAIASASSATIYVTTTLLPALGMDASTTKILNTGKPAIASGEADVVILPVSELLHAPEVDFVGTIPQKLQHLSVFSAAIVNGTTQMQAAKQLIAFITAPTATKAIKNSGMEPANK
jgi:molybdate transport system substrate-binding protein